MKGWMTIPNTRSLDPGSYVLVRFLPLLVQGDGSLKSGI